MPKKKAAKKKAPKTKKKPTRGFQGIYQAKKKPTKKNGSP